MRSPLLFAALCVTGALALGACGAPADAGDVTATSSDALSALGRSLVGSFTRVDGFGAPTDLTFNADGTYAASNVVKCIAAPCPPVTSSGTWTTAGSASNGTLRLAPSNDVVKTYGVRLTNGTALTLTTTDRAHLVAHMTRVVVDVPELCGGIGALKCPAGKTCVPDDGPSHPDAAGKCYAQGARGTICGGFGGLKCDTGLTCIITDTFADATGFCRAPGDLDTFCGGIGGLKCNTGLVCKITETGHTDLGGVCAAP